MAVLFVCWLVVAAATATAAQAPLHPLQRRRTTENCDSPETPPPRNLQQAQTEDPTAAARLRSDLLQDYDRGAFPWEYAWEQSGWNSSSSLKNRTGLNVEVGINFHRVFSVDVKSSVADLIVWFRQRWTDPRLAWDPNDYSGLTTTWFWISDGVGSGEMSEIWTPDFQLWNMESSLSETLTDSYATVDSSGTVFWSRPGHLRPACKFEGLDSFPFDSLICTMEFGSWSYSGLYLRPTKMDEGFTVGGSDTAGEAFAEYKLASDDDAIQCRQHVYPPYPALPEEDWPVLLYDVAFHRSWQPYVRGYVLMQVILNVAGFGSFWLPVPSGERMGLTITAMLAAVASELVVAASLPTAAEMTWFQTFSLFSLSFAAFSLFESIAVIYFFYYTGKDLVPGWWRWMERQCKNCYGRIIGKSKSNQTTTKNVKEETERVVYETEQDNSDSHGEKDATHASPDEEDNSCEKGSVYVDLPQDAEQMSARGVDDDDHDKDVHFADSQATGRPARRPSLVMDRRSSQRGGHDADDFRDVQEAENNKRWQVVAKTIDEACRVGIPVIYAVVLAILMTRVHYF